VGSEYHKINTIFKRDFKTNQLIEGDWVDEEIEYLASNEWSFSEKIDGTNIRIMFDGEKVSFGGRTENAAIPSKLVARLIERFPDGKSFKEAFDCGGVCLYGEGYGAGIQKGGVYRQDQDFILFDVKVGDWWLQRSSVEDIATKLGLGIVPIIGHGTLHDCISLVRGGMKSQIGDCQSEGIVARPKAMLFNRKGDRIIAKIKTRDFK
jgi:RNA ligase